LAEEFTKDKRKFMKNAEDYVKKHAEPRPSWSAHSFATMPVHIVFLRCVFRDLTRLIFFPFAVLGFIIFWRISLLILCKTIWTPVFNLEFDPVCEWFCFAPLFRNFGLGYCSKYQTLKRKSLQYWSDINFSQDFDYFLADEILLHNPPGITRNFFSISTSLRTHWITVENINLHRRKCVCHRIGV
jgi:hypothetical protein